MKEVIKDFIDGQRDCKEGIEHQAGKSKDYDRGYAAQYELEQMNNERAAQKGHK